MPNRSFWCLNYRLHSPPKTSSRDSREKLAWLKLNSSEICTGVSDLRAVFWSQVTRSLWSKLQLGFWTQQIDFYFFCVRRWLFEGTVFIFSPRLELRRDLWNVTGLRHHPAKNRKERKSHCLLAALKVWIWIISTNTVQTLLTFIGCLSMALRRDHNLSGFLWWWCRLRRQTQTWRSLCLWRRSCESRFLWCLDACSGPRTAIWCSYRHPHRYWGLNEKDIKIKGHI